MENFSNFIRFRSVCKEWRSTIGPNEHFPHLPWILYPMGGCDTTDYCIYSLSSNTRCQIKLPVNHKEWINFNNVESTNGFLLFKHSISKIPYLFNPITKSEIYPPLTEEDPPHCNILYMDPHPNGTSRTEKGGVPLVLCSTMGITREHKLLVGLWKSDSIEFTNFRIPLSSTEMAYYKGKLFVNSWPYSETWIFDMNTGAEVGLAIPDAVEYHGYRILFEAMGNLLMVARKIADDDPSKIQFNVYRLDHTYNFEQCRWIELKGIGDRILFIGWSGGSVNAFCLSTSNVNGLKGNCIYYLRNNDVLRYNMEDGTTDHISYTASRAKWFMPSYN